MFVNQQISRLKPPSEKADSDSKLEDQPSKPPEEIKIKPKKTQLFPKRRA